MTDITANEEIPAATGNGVPLNSLSEQTHLAHLDNADQIRSAFTVMQQLRPHLNNADDLLQRIQRMQRHAGYRILAVLDSTNVIALAGYRLQENLIYGPFLYVDDLVTVDTARGQRCGARLLAALQDIARKAKCTRLVLDTGIGNSLAQRFYFRQGLLGLGMHFSMPLSEKNASTTE